LWPAIRPGCVLSDALVLAVTSGRGRQRRSRSLRDQGPHQPAGYGKADHDPPLPPPLLRHASEAGTAGRPGDAGVPPSGFGGRGRPLRGRRLRTWRYSSRVVPRFKRIQSPGPRKQVDALITGARLV
jgi:hypothetical protein